MMKEFRIDNYDQNFRIKQMNAIEALALRSQINTESFEQTIQFFNLILEHLEVEVMGKWMPVKTKGMDVYYPAEIENDVHAIEQLIEHFTNDFLKPVFMSSNESEA